MSIGLVVDSTCDLSQGIIDNYQIEIVPLSIHFGEDVFLDRIELGSEDFFTKLEQTEMLPTTSQPAIGYFTQKYEEMSEKYDTIISIHLSAKLSGTVKAAQMAARQMDELDIKVIDSRSASLGLGYLALYAANLIKSGEIPSEIVRQVKQARNNISIYFTVNDLSYLEKGGRIGKAQAFLGSILNVCPILYLPGDSGEILPLEKVRGKKRANKKLIQLTLEQLQDENKAWLGLLHGTNLDFFNKFRDLLMTSIDNHNILYRTDSNFVSSVLGCHVGPSVYGIVILKGDFLTI